jgi:multicomponent Na+:H+ antiporter subunit B
MSLVIRMVAPRLLGPALMVAAALIVKGYTDVGDGFSAGVIVALAVALQYIALGPEAVEASLPAVRRAPAAAVAGLLVAVAVGFFPVVLGEPPFTHRPLPGELPLKLGTLEFVTAVAFDLGLFVLVAAALVMVVRQLAYLVRGTDT